jgi:hypothetical protein
MLWDHYVFRRGNDVFDLWDDLFQRQDLRILYITGRGFDSRATLVLDRLLSHLKAQGASISNATLVLVSFSGYELSAELHQETEKNGQELRQLFMPFGPIHDESIGINAEGEDDRTAFHLLREGVVRILERLPGYTDVILDVSSIPRVLYVTLITAILEALVPNRTMKSPLRAGDVNFQVLVAEDAELDARIHSEDPNHELIMIPGYSSGLQMESTRDWPSVWIPILGEGRTAQLEKVMAAIPAASEVCPVVPSPSKDPRRADRLLLEYRESLFQRMQTPKNNVLYAREANPFESYRQVYGAMERYRASLSLLGGVRFVITPFASKLMTIGVSLACFEMRPSSSDAAHSVAIPYAEPTRYSATVADLRNSKPELAALLLTGVAYA